MSYLQLNNLTKTFPASAKGQHLKVLNGLSFVVDKGEFICLIGPSSCGKSTLLRIVDGLIPADSGEVLIDGTAVTKPPANCGFVFQQFNLLPWRTALGNVEFALEPCHLSAQERRGRARRALERVHLAGFESYYPAQLSGGMQQRVGLARALVIDPDLLLMDEPFGSLDAQTRETMQNELLRLWALQQCTVLFVTHDIEEAVFLADQILIMSPRPASIAATVPVCFPRPRDETLRSTPEFAQMRGQVSLLLKRAVGETGRE